MPQTLLRVRGAAMVALGAAAIACSNTPGPAPGLLGDNTPSSNHVSLQLFGYDEMEAEHFRNVSGHVFLVRFLPEEGKRIEWVDCAAPATYKYQQSDGGEEDLYVQNEAELQAKLPLGAVNLAGYFSQGKRLRVRYATAGSFEIQEGFKVPEECSRATHFVSTFTVGAYAISALSDLETGVSGSARVGSLGGGIGDMSTSTMNKGDLDACRKVRGASRDGPLLPVQGCQTPLKILLVPVGRHFANVPAPPPSRQAELTDRTLPGAGNSGTGNLPPPAAPAGAAPDLRHQTCFQNLPATGRADEDLKAVTDHCGGPLGLRPVGAPFSDVLGQGEAPHQYEAKLEAGGCYRVFAASDASIGDLDTGLLDPQGAVIAKDMLQDNAPILRPEGPFCVRDAGAYKLLVVVQRGRGRYAVQLWKVAR